MNVYNQEEEEAEAFTKLSQQGGVLVVGAWAGVTRTSGITTDREAMVFISVAHDKI